MPTPTAPDDAASPPAGRDPLLWAVAWLARRHGVDRSARAWRHGWPVDGGLTAPLALRVLDEAGFKAGVIERPLAEIDPLLLPAVLLLHDRRVAIALRREPGDGSRPARWALRLPPASAGADEGAASASMDTTAHERDDGELHQVDEDTLAAQHTGAWLVASPRPAATPSAGGYADAAPGAPLLEPGRHWLWGTLRRFAPYYRSAMLAALLSNVLMLAGGLVSSIVFDKVIPHQSFVTLWALAAGGALALVGDMAARQLRSHLIDQAGKKADLIVGSLLFRQTLAVRMEHRPPSAGSYAHTLAQVELVRDFCTSATLSALTDLPFVALFIAMIFLTAGSLGWVMVIAVPLILGMAALIQARVKRAMRASMAHQAELQGVLVEAIEGLEDLKTAGAEGRFLRRYEHATAAGAQAALETRALSSWTGNLASAAQQLVTLVMLVWGVYLIQAGSLTGGALIGAVMFAGRAIGPLSSVVGLATRYQGARAAMVALDRLMAQPTESGPGRSHVAHFRPTGRVALHEVGFAYPPVALPGGAPQALPPRVLAGVTLRFEPGERVAILGRIGSGKSTILRLLAGLYQPTEGRVEADGIDLRQVDPADFRAGVGFVSQEPRLFQGTLRDNVVMGRPSIDAARLAEVARLTGLDRVVAGHPQGWDLPVGEMGALLSGGQRQLVALARCLATGPQLLLMDEPTSSMDAQSETQFLRQLADAVGRRTLVMVTHRPAVLELAERVIVIDEGKVLIDGPKARVLAVLAGVRAQGGAAPTAPAHPAPAREPLAAVA